MSKYKVGDKVVLEITDKIEVTEEPWYILSDATSIFESHLDKAAEPLSTYTDPLERKNENKQKQIEKLVDKLHRQAAEITRLLAENKELKNKEQELTRERNQLMGRCGGLSAARIKEFNNGRLAGQNEAWELARKIFDMETNDIEDIFIKEDAWNLGTDLNNYTYQEAAAKVAEWEKVKEEIKVGDVYMSQVGNYFVIYGVDREKDIAKILWSDLSISARKLDDIKEYYIKTGRHIDIDSFLKQIGGKEK